MKTYDVQVERGDKYWLVYVPAVDRTTQSRTLREVEAMARDLIAIMLDVAPNSFSLKTDIELPAHASEYIEASTQARIVEAQARVTAASQIRLAAKALKNEGVSLRDIGEVLGVSFQRASQLVKGSSQKTGRSAIVSREFSRRNRVISMRSSVVKPALSPRSTRA